jgi:hypothetical protein
MISHAGRGASRRPGASPTTRQPGGSPRRNRCVRRPALPPGCRVVALGEVEETPHAAQLGLVAAVLPVAHLGDLPARRGRDR